MWGSPSARTEDDVIQFSSHSREGRQCRFCRHPPGLQLIAFRPTQHVARACGLGIARHAHLGMPISDTRLNDLVRPLVGAVPAVVASAWWCTLPQRLLLVVQLLPLFPLSLPPFLSLFLLARSCLHLQSARQRGRDVRRVLTHLRQVRLGQDRGVPSTPGSTEHGCDEQQPRRTRCAHHQGGSGRKRCDSWWAGGRRSLRRRLQRRRRWRRRQRQQQQRWGRRWQWRRRSGRRSE